MASNNKATDSAASTSEMEPGEEPKDEPDDELESGLEDGSRTTTPDSSQTAAGVQVFDDEELHHTLEPSFLGTLSLVDLILTACTLGAWLIVPYLRSRNTAYVITSDRLIDKQGSVTGHSTEEVRFDDIVGDIKTSQGLVEGILDRGTIEFQIEKERRTAATSRQSTERESERAEMNVERRDIELNGIRNYTDVSNTIRRIAHS